MEHSWKHSYPDATEMIENFDSKSWRLVEIRSSEGNILASLSTGKIKYIEAEEDSYLHNIRIFDFDEWRDYWKKEVPDSLDILDLAYSNKDFSNEAPAWDWREEIKLVRQQNEK